MGYQHHGQLPGGPPNDKAQMREYFIREEECVQVDGEYGTVTVNCVAPPCVALYRSDGCLSV